MDQMEEEMRLLWCGPDGGGGEAAVVKEEVRLLM